MSLSVTTRLKWSSAVWASAVLLALLASASRAKPARAAQVLHLPYPAGLSVSIIQGYNGGTHQGVERYSLDLVRTDGKTNGSPVVAPASGTVAFAELPGQQTGCIGVAMDDAGDFHYMLCHIILNRTYGYGDRIQIGQQLGTVGAPGLVGNNGTSHIHMQLYTLPGGQRTPQPYAAPSGIPLEGVSMPQDGTYNQWACPSAACGKLVSSVPNSGATLLTAESGPAGGPGATPSISASASLTVGEVAVVNGTGDCVRVHSQPSVVSVTNGCAPDGTVVYLTDGPRQGDGYTWWNLRTLGWAVADYLKPASSTPALPSAAASQPVPVPAANTAAIASSQSLAIGMAVNVAGTGDCLRLHASPSVDDTVVNCLADGATSVIRGGPSQAEGHTWWLLDAGGWAVGDYLQAPA
jgi:hypothetical protein